MNERKEAIKVLNLDHLGIINEMELVEEVNKIVEIKSKKNLSPGQVMKAMLLNGLGFLSAHYTYSRKFLSAKQQSI